MQLGECLGKEKLHLEQTWKEVQGRYDMAVQQLLVEVIIESRNPVEKIVQALRQNMLSAEVCQRATETIKKGYFTSITQYGSTTSYGLYPHRKPFSLSQFHFK